MNTKILITIIIVLLVILGGVMYVSRQPKVLETTPQQELSQSKKIESIELSNDREAILRDHERFSAATTLPRYIHGYFLEGGENYQPTNIYPDTLELLGLNNLAVKLKADPKSGQSYYYKTNNKGVSFELRIQFETKSGFDEYINAYSSEGYEVKYSNDGTVIVTEDTPYLTFGLHKKILDTHRKFRDSN